MFRDQRVSIIPRKTAVLIVLAGVLILPSGHAAPRTSNILNRIDRIVADALRDGPIAGASIAVVRGRHTIVAKGYGYANVEHKVHATADTRVSHRFDHQARDRRGHPATGR